MKNNQCKYTALLSIILVSSINTLIHAAQTYDQKDSLHHALKYKQKERALTLIATPRRHCADTAEITPLHIACFDGNYDLASAIINQKVNLHTVNCFGRTPLHDAAHAGASSIVKLLLEHGANPNAQDHKKATPLFIATRFDLERLEVIRLLLAAGARPDIARTGGFTPLHRAAYKQQPQTVDLLIKYGAPLNAQNMFGRTPLHDIVRHNTGSNDCISIIVRRLLDAGAALEIKDGEEKTPLFVATENAFENANVVQELLKRGANPNTVAQSITPLHVAAFHSYQAASQALCNAGAHLDTQNFLGKTPLHDALGYYYADKPYGMHVWSEPIIRKLLKHGARMDIPDKEGNTAQLLDKKGGWTTVKNGEKYHRSGYMQKYLSDSVNLGY